MMDWMRRGVVKRPERSIDKALACYGGDVSRLTDLCRARIAFATAEGLAACVGLVARDQALGAVEVLRVRNWMRDEHDAWPTAGFRVSKHAYGARAHACGARAYRHT